MAGEKTVKVRFTGDSKGLSAAAKVAERVVKAWGRQVDQVRKRAESWAGSDNSAKKWAGKVALALDSVVTTAGKVGKGVMGAISGAVQAGGPLVQAALTAAMAAAAAAAAPTIAAAISSAVLLGVGGGVIAGGILLAAKSPKVTDAAESLKNRFLDIDTTELEERYKAAQERMTTATGREAKKRAAKELAEAKKALDEANKYNEKNFSLRDAARPFIDPLVRAMGTFEKAADKIIPRFESMSKTLAPVIDKLAPALVKMADQAMPGIERAAKASLPFFDTLAEHMPQIGNAIGKFFDRIAESGPDARVFFTDVLDTIEGAIVVLGEVISWLARMYSKAREVWAGFARVGLGALDALLTAAAKAFSWVPGLGPKLEQAAKDFDDFKRKVNNSLAGIKDKTVNVDVAVKVTGYRGANTSAVRHALEKQNVPGFATGGWARGIYLAGENGPELIRSGAGAGRADRVYSNRQTEALLNPEIHVYIGDQELRGLVRVEIADHDRGVRRRVLAGTGAAR